MDVATGEQCARDIQKDGKGDHPKDSELKQDFNMWMTKPSLRKRLLLSVGDRQGVLRFPERGLQARSIMPVLAHVCGAAVNPSTTATASKATGYAEHRLHP